MGIKLEGDQDFVLDTNLSVVTRVTSKAERPRAINGRLESSDFKRGDIWHLDYAPGWGYKEVEVTVQVTSKRGGTLYVEEYENGTCTPFPNIRIRDIIRATKLR